jgi:rod shape-determining protein MreB
MEVRGLNLISGLPRTVTITSSEIREAMTEPVSAIVDAVRDTLEKTPPELAADIIDRGIVLCGGGAMIRNLDVLLSEECALPVFVAENPLHAVVDGVGTVLENLAKYQRLLL